VYRLAKLSMITFHVVRRPTGSVLGPRVFVQIAYIKQNLNQFLLVVKATALKQQISQIVSANSKHRC